MHVCHCCAGQLCAHVCMVYLFLSPNISNSAIFEPLFSVAPKRGCEDKWDTFTSVDTDSTEHDDVHDDRDSTDAKSVLPDKAQQFTNEYVYKFNRYPEEDDHITHLIANCASVCKDSACSTRGLTGGGANACKHTYPFEFHAPATLTDCALCGNRVVFLCVCAYCCFALSH